MDYKAIGMRLRQMRREQGLTQRQVADALGMTDSNVSLIESGRIATPVENLERYADLVGARVVVDIVDPADPLQALLELMRAAGPTLRPSDMRAITALLEVYVHEDTGEFAAVKSA